MKLTTDDRCRLQSRELFKPSTPYDGDKGPDGTITFKELVPSQAPLVKARRIGGRLRGAVLTLDRRTVAAAIRADRDR